MINFSDFGQIGVTIGGGFFVGILIGYAIKKVVKLAAVVIGLFFAGIAYLQYQQILSVNWNKLQATSQNLLSNLANSTSQIPGFNANGHSILAIMNLGIPLTGSLSMGFAIGFLKG
jgi:uncharacterized membrane protein (Fun14 family)